MKGNPAAYDNNFAIVIVDIRIQHIPLVQVFQEHSEKSRMHDLSDPDDAIDWFLISEPFVLIVLEDKQSVIIVLCYLDGYIPWSQHRDRPATSA